MVQFDPQGLFEFATEDTPNESVEYMTEQEITEHGSTSETAAAESVDTSASFDDFNLGPEIIQAIAEMGFETPTPVQARTYETAMAGKNMIAMAQTGTGKTAAFGIPMARKLNPEKKQVQALALVPTRELALQVSKELTAIGNIRGIRSAAVYGGASFTKQVDEVKKGACIVVGTPGRVLDHIRRKTIRFDELEILVLDEADEMLSMGFEKEISEILEALPQKRQTLLFSATIPEDIQRLSKRYIGDPVIISVSGDAIGAKDVTHFVYLVSGQMRQQMMVKVIEAEKPDSALVFCNTREETQSLAQYLKKSGYNADWINSDLTQHDRERVMRKTRNGEIQFLVATDVAARGIDVSHLSHVINYTFPESLEVYIHRTGRTGRAGRQGTAISLISPQDLGNLYMLRLTYKIFPVEKTLPDDKDAARALELDRMARLRKRYTTKNNEAFFSLARRLVQDLRAESIIAGLLAEHFGGDISKRTDIQSAGEGPQEGRHQDATPFPEQGDQPRRESGDQKATIPEEKKEGDGDRRSDAFIGHRETAPTNTHASADLTEPPPKDDVDTKEPREDKRSTEEDSKEIYVDAGRKDGLRISDLMKTIMQRTGLPRTALGKVRMLARSTFLSVPKEYFEPVLQSLSGTELAGSKRKAEPAKQR